MVALEGLGLFVKPQWQRLTGRSAAPWGETLVPWLFLKRPDLRVAPENCGLGPRHHTKTSPYGRSPW